MLFSQQARKRFRVALFCLAGYVALAALLALALPWARTTFLGNFAVWLLAIPLAILVWFAHHFIDRMAEGRPGRGKISRPVRIALLVLLYAVFILVVVVALHLMSASHEF